MIGITILSLSSADNEVIVVVTAATKGLRHVHTITRPLLFLLAEYSALIKLPQLVRPTRRTIVADSQISILATDEIKRNPKLSAAIIPVSRVSHDTTSQLSFNFRPGQALIHTPSFTLSVSPGYLRRVSL